MNLSFSCACWSVGGRGREHEDMHLDVQFGRVVSHRLACLDLGRWQQQNVKVCDLWCFKWF